MLNLSKPVSFVKGDILTRRYIKWEPRQVTYPTMTLEVFFALRKGELLVGSRSCGYSFPLGNFAIKIDQGSQGPVAFAFWDNFLPPCLVVRVTF